MAGKCQYKYKDDMPQRLMDYGKKGYSLAMVAAEFGIAKRTIFQWLSDPAQYPDFCAAREMYDTYLHAYIDNQLKELADATTKKNPKSLSAVIYRARVLLSRKNPEYNIDLTREIKTQQIPNSVDYKAEINKILGIASANKPKLIESGQSDSGTAGEIIPAVATPVENREAE